MRGRRLVCLFLCALLMGGCMNPSSEKQQEGKEGSGKIQIGLALDSRVLERWERDTGTFIAEAERMGAEVETVNANADVEEQIRQVEAFTEEKKDVIVIIAADCERLREPLEKAKEKGIKVVCYDRLVMDLDADLYISFDNDKVGSLMAGTMMESLPDGGKIMMICGPKSDNNAIVIENAFLREIEGSNLEVVQVSYAKSWTPEYAFQSVEEAFEGIDRIDGVMCGNDALAVRAIQALAERRLAGKVCVVGQDADVEACQKIAEGVQAMTVYKAVEELAKQAAEYSVMLAQNIPLTDVTEPMENGRYTIRSKELEPVAVTRENLDEVIIDSGFHSREEVYLNTVP